MEPKPVDREHLRHHSDGSNPMLTTRIRKLIEEAQRAQSYLAHTPPGFQEPTAYIAQRAVASLVLALNSDSLPGLVGADGRIRKAPVAAVAGETVKLAAGVIAASRVADAGAHILVRPEPTRAHALGKTGGIAVESVASSFRLVDPATFSAVPDDAEVATSPFPVTSAEIDWATSTSQGVRFELRRRDLRDLGAEFVATEAVRAIVLGLGRAADKALMSAIESTLPSRFALSDAAAKGLRFGELFGFLGRNSGAGHVTEAGMLHVNVVTADGSAPRHEYVKAELSADLERSIIGAWSRAAVAIHEDVPLHFERLNANGDLAITAWVNLIPLLPDASCFWHAELA